jgi:hypothetical protein
MNELPVQYHIALSRIIFLQEPSIFVYGEKCYVTTN